MKPIFFIKNYTLDEIVKKHIDYVNRPPRKTLINYWDIPMISGVKFTPIYEVENKKTVKPPSKTILRDKYQFLIHTIITRCYDNKEGIATLNAGVLKSVLGSVYKDMIYNLQDMNIISVSDTYIRGVKSRTFYILDGIETYYKRVFTNKIDKYLIKLTQELTKHNKQDIETHKKQIGNNLYTNYVKSLCKLRMIKPKEALEYCDNTIFENIHSKNYYINIIRKYNNNDYNNITIDKNNRIYSILTSTPRNLKPYLNILYQIDINNSHPLLFVYNIIKQYNINNDLYKAIISISLDNHTNVYNDGKYICNELKNSGISIKNIPYDIVEYIYKTSKGLFWNDFIELFPEHERAEVKVKLFKEIFYSKRINIKVFKKYGVFAKCFKSKYPHVYSLIRNMRKQDKTRTALANNLMRLESKLFHDILKKLYKMNYRVLSIHDAVIVLDVKENSLCKPKIVQNVIQSVYNTYNLYPTMSVERY